MLSILGAYMDPEWPAAHSGDSILPPGPLLRRNGYGEATAFRKLNERLLQFAGSDWDNPERFLEYRLEAAAEKRCVAAIRSASYGSLQRGYLSLAPSKQPAAWGWKDPRNSLTLSAWLKVFPEARILHVRRNADDIVDSLIKRATASRSEAPTPPSLKDRLIRVASNPARLAAAIGNRIKPGALLSPEGPPTLDRQRCYELTTLYVGECLRYRAVGRQYEEVHYEDILRAPRTLAMNIAEFAGLAPSHQSVSDAAAIVSQDGRQPGITTQQQLKSA